MVSVLLFFDRFSIRIRFVARKYRSLGHAVDHPIYSLESRFYLFLLALLRISACL
jgi:hypothetical protein